MLIGEHEFKSVCEPVEVTSARRPDTNWRHVDSSGHAHQWFSKGQPATDYDPQHSYDLPTLIHVVEIEGTDDYPGRSHYECKECRERVEPRLTADSSRRFMPGPRYFSIDGVGVTRDEFERRLRENWPSNWPALELPKE